MLEQADGGGGGGRTGSVLDRGKQSRIRLKKKKSADCTRHGRLAYSYSTFEAGIVLSHIKAAFDSCSIAAVEVDGLREFMGMTRTFLL